MPAMGKLALAIVVLAMHTSLLVLIIAGYVDAVFLRWIIIVRGLITVSATVTILTSSGLSFLSA
jgi:hypothetical protein